MNLTVVPLGTVGFTGVTVTDTSLTAVTVNFADPAAPDEMVPRDAEMVEVPALRPVASPPMTIAMVGLEEVHVTSEVMSCVPLGL